MMGGLGRRSRTDSASPYKGTALKRLEWVETARGIYPTLRQSMRHEQLDHKVIIVFIAHNTPKNVYFK